MKAKEKTTRKSTKPTPADPYDLQNLCTRVLLKYLSAAFVTFFHNDDYDPEKDCRTVGIRPDHHGQVITRKALKAELVHREHVRNKLEARQFRRAMSMQNRGTRLTKGAR